jgi:hypothetical protein
MRRPAFGVRFLTNLGTLALGGVAKLALTGMSDPSSRVFAVLSSSAMRWQLVSLISALSTPFFLVATALLYLRAREAEGNPVRPRSSDR